MIRILIVDDEEHIVNTIKDVIKRKKNEVFDIIEARDGKTAFDLIINKKPDIVITDMKMPYLDGADLLKKSSDLGMNIEIIVVSGYNDFRYTQQAIKSNILDYILKPINPAELILIIEKAIKKIRNSIDRQARLDSNNVNLSVKIKVYLEENYSKSIRLEDLSETFYISRESMIKKFKSDFKMGIYEYVMILRMDKAKFLLRNFNLQIQEVAQKVGFNDANYFSKAYKKYYGESPKNTKSNRL